MVKTLLLTLLGFICATSALPSSIHDPQWDSYKNKYKKVYKDSDDESARYSLFRISRERVAELNKLNGAAGPAFGINWMSDRYPHEQAPPPPPRIFSYFSVDQHLY